MDVVVVTHLVTCYFEIVAYWSGGDRRKMIRKRRGEILLGVVATCVAVEFKTLFLIGCNGQLVQEFAIAVDCLIVVSKGTASNAGGGQGSGNLMDVVGDKAVQMLAT